jgi:hypothetical protein
MFLGRGHARGFIVDHGGDGQKRGFWGWYVDMGGAFSRYEAIRKLAVKVGVDIHDKHPITDDTVLQYQLAMTESVLAELLRSRGITEKTAKTFRLGWDNRRKMWAIPILDADGKLLNIKFHGKGPTKSSWKNEGTSPVLFNAHTAKQAQDGEFVVITEGELDAIVLHQTTGICAVSGTAGCNTWNPAWAESLLGKHIVLCYDSDVEGRTWADRVCKEYLYPRLLDNSFASLRVLDLYPDTADKQHKDVTDYVVHDGKTDLADRIAHADEYTYSTPQDKAIATNAGIVACPAIVDKGRNVVIVPGEKETIVANFIPYVVRTTETVKQSSTDHGRMVQVAIQGNGWKRMLDLDAGKYLDDKEFRTAVGVAAGPLAAFDAQKVGAIRLAGHQASENITSITRYQGFGNVQGRLPLTYISPSVCVVDGKIMKSEDFAEAEIVADESGRGSAMLDFSVAPLADVKRLLALTVDCMSELYSTELMGAILGSVALACVQDMDGVAEIFDSRVALWLVGPSGAGKSELALFAMRFFGQFKKDHLPAWSDTSNSIQAEMAAFTSAICVADDWRHSSGNVGEQGAQRKLLQSYNSGRARGRATRFGSNRNNAAIRCQLIVTAEESPSNDPALIARGIFCDATRIRMNTEKWSTLKTASLKFNSITPHLVAWLQRQGQNDVIKQVRQAWVIFEAEARVSGISDENLSRHCSNLALMYCGYDLFMQFLASMGVQGLDEKRCRMFVSDYLRMLSLQLPESISRIRREKPAEVFIAIISSMISSKRAQILELHPDVSGKMVSSGEISDRSPVVGYHYKNEYWLLPTEAVTEVNSFLLRGGHRWEYSSKAVSGGLIAGSYLVMSDEARSCIHRVSINGVRVYVWKLPDRVILEDLWDTRIIMRSLETVDQSTVILESLAAESEKSIEKPDEAEIVF